jgi:hypothetical protein
VLGWSCKIEEQRLRSVISISAEPRVDPRGGYCSVQLGCERRILDFSEQFRSVNDCSEG